MLLEGRRYDTGEAVVVSIDGPRLAAVSPRTAPRAGLPWLAPALVDLQVNGYDGQEFSSSDLTPEHVRAIVARHVSFGVGALCPTLTTNAAQVFDHALAVIAAACERWPEVAHAVPGIHLEGPYLSGEEGPRGAHPAEHCRPPDWDEFCRWQNAASGRIKLITLSPEYDEAPTFIERAVRSGVLVSIGHAAATSEQIRAAVDAGATLSTHLGNGAHRTLPRHPNYLWDQLADDRLTASLICDGHHLPPEVVQTFVRAKTPARCILVSDESGLAGLPPGRYASSGCELDILSDGRLVIAGQRQLLAGASRPLGAGVAHVMRFAGVSLREAIEMASVRPAALLGRPVCRFERGDPADLVAFDLTDSADGSPSFDVRQTIIRGCIAYGR
ncbi:MAG: amidohydrolase family protein [Pirellulales bacterium]